MASSDVKTAKNAPKTAAIIAAAGNSTRMGKGQNKQFICVAGVPVLARTLLAFENAAEIGEIVVVTREGDFDAVFSLAERYHITKFTAAAAGGETRAQSVQNGFALIHPYARYVAIHDGARCLVTPEGIDAVCRAAYRYRAASAVTTVTDTVKTVNSRGYITGTIPRDTLLLAQTPQVFDTNLYRAALATLKSTEEFTDDNQLAEGVRYPVKPVDLGAENIKITRPADVALAEWILSRREDKQ